MYGQQPPPYPLMTPGQPPQPPVVPPRGNSVVVGGGRGLPSDIGSSSSLDSSVLGVLRNMEREDLQRLDDRAIDSLISDDGDLNKLQEHKATETASNRSLAEHTLTYQTQLNQAKRALIAAHKEAGELARCQRDLRDRLQREQRGGGGGESLDNLHTLLQSACLEAEDTGEALIESLLSGQLALPEFVTRYTEARALYHTRRAKTDKVTEISNQRLVQQVHQPQHQQQHQQQAPPTGPGAGAYGMPSYYYPTPAYRP